LARPVSDFYVAGRLVPSVFNGMAIAASFMAVLAFAALAGAVGPGWEGSRTLLLAGAGGLVLGGVLLAPYLRKFGGYTIPDFLAERFGGVGIRPLAVLAVILSCFAVLALVLWCLGHITARLFPLDLATGIAAGAGLLLLCTLIGGMRSASITQIAQYAILLITSLGLALFLWRGGTAFAPASLDDVLAALKLDALSTADPFNRFALIFSLVSGVATLPHLLMRGSTTPSVAEARTSFLLAVPLAALLCLGARAYPALFDTSAATGASASMVGLLAIAAIAALLAAGSGLLLAIANALSHDVFYKALHPRASTGQRLIAARGAIVLVAVLAGFAAFAAPQALPDMAASSFSLAASAFLPALLLGVWWKRATPEGALAGMLAGLAVCLYYLLAPRYFPFAFYETSSFLSSATPELAADYAELRQSYYLADEAGREAALTAWGDTARAAANWWGVKNAFASLFAVPFGFLVMIGVSLFTPAPSRDVQNFVEDLRRPATERA
jgi:cation/acetate symporter